MNKNLNILVKEVFLLLLFLLPISSISQELSPHSTSFYSGIYGGEFNPSIPLNDTPYDYELNLLTGGINLENNYSSFSFLEYFNLNDYYNLNKVFPNDKTTTDVKDLLLRTGFVGPSFSFKTGRFYMSFMTGAGFNIGFEGVSKQFIDLLSNSLSSQSSFLSTLIANSGNSISVPNFKLTGSGYFKTGIGISTYLYKGKGSRFKIGANVFALFGAGGYYFEGNDLVFNRNGNNNSSVNGELKYGYTNNIEGTSYSFSFKGPISWGGSFGFTYEYVSSEDKDGLYSFRIGGSITDYGKYTINYDKNGILNVSLPNLVDANFRTNNTLSGSLDTFISKNGLSPADFSTSKEYALPTSINGHIDFKLTKGLYTTLATSFPIDIMGTGVLTYKRYTNYYIIPRYINNNLGFEFSFPVSYNKLSSFKTGLILGSRYITLGIDNFFTITSSIYLGLKIPINGSRDKVKDEPEDTDGDGIIDIEDACPKIYGIKEFNGCPDTDGDGIEDKEDMCVDIPGTLSGKGCPDTDGDGIIDKDDNCIDTPGTQYCDGCPDTDGDEIPDYIDDCPDTFGLLDNNGCPKKEEKKKEKTITVEKSNYKFEQVDISFSGSSDIVNKSLAKKLDLNIASYIQAVKGGKRIKICGYADPAGSPAFNIRIARDRAIAIKKYFISRGIPANKIEVISKGDEDFEGIKNITPEEREHMRRVEVFLD